MTPVKKALFIFVVWFAFQSSSNGLNIVSVQNIAVVAAPAATGAMTVAMDAGSVVTITPTGACTFNATGGAPGARMSFIVTTSGTTSRVLTFGTNFKAQGTLATGTVTAKVFVVSFVCKDGTLWVEVGRTTAM